MVAVSGRLQQEVYEKDGQKRSAYRAIGYVEFLAAPRNGAGDSAQESEDWRSDLPDEGRDWGPDKRSAGGAPADRLGRAERA